MKMLQVAWPGGHCCLPNQDNMRAAHTCFGSWRCSKDCTATHGLGLLRPSENFEEETQWSGQPRRLVGTPPPQAPCSVVTTRVAETLQTSDDQEKLGSPSKLPEVEVETGCSPEGEQTGCKLVGPVAGLFSCSTRTYFFGKLYCLQSIHILESYLAGVHPLRPEVGGP